MDIRPLSAGDRAWVRCLVTQRWGAEIVIAHGAIFCPAELAGLLAEIDGETVGLVTYHIAGHACEIVTLDSLRPRLGVGTALLDAVEAAARDG